MNVPTLLIGQGSFDPAAAAYFAAAGITDAAQKTALNQLVLDLKSYSLWAKMTGAYPFPKDATANAVNLKSPGTNDLVFHGSLTHSTNGCLPDGSTGYADTGISSDALAQDSAHLSYYSRTNVAGFTIEIGTYSAGRAKVSGLNCGKATDSASSFINSAESGGLTSTGVTDTSGLFVVSRTGASSDALYRNGSLVHGGTHSSVAMFPYNYLIFARSLDSSAVGNYSSRQGAWASVGSGLDATDVANLYTAVQAYQTALGRQV